MASNTFVPMLIGHFNDFGTLADTYLTAIDVGLGTDEVEVIILKSLDNNGYKELHNTGGTIFSLSHGTIPEWFDLRTKGGSISFWFRNKFPALVVCLVIGLPNKELFSIRIRSGGVIINGNERFDVPVIDACVIINGNEQRHVPSTTFIAEDHIFVFDLRSIEYSDKVEDASLEKEWKHVEIYYEDRSIRLSNEEDSIEGVCKESGIYVLKEIDKMEDIRFTNPYIDNEGNEISGHAPSETVISGSDSTMSSSTISDTSSSYGGMSLPLSKELLKKYRGTNNIEGLMLDMPEPEEKVHISGKAFANMKKLRLLRVHNANISDDIQYLSDELRLIDWPRYPSSTLPPNFHPKRLVSLNLSHGRIKHLWKGAKILRDLKLVSFNCCEYLTEIPDFSMIPNLESLNLEHCKTLVKIHESIGSLSKLVTLNLVFCSNLKSLPSYFKLKYLHTLLLTGCSNLRKFPEISDKMEFVEEILLEGTSIKELPQSIENLIALKCLVLDFCQKLENLPSSIQNLQYLTTLSLTNCSKLKEIPKLPLKTSYIDTNNCTSLENFPDLSTTSSFSSSQEFPRFSHMSFINCHRLIHKKIQDHIANYLFYEESISEEVIFPGSKIPDWFDYHSTNDSPMISLDVASRLYGKPVELYFGAVFELNDKARRRGSGSGIFLCVYEIVINHKKTLIIDTSFDSLETSHVWLSKIKFGRLMWPYINHSKSSSMRYWNHVEVSFRISPVEVSSSKDDDVKVNAVLKCCGFHISCKQEGSLQKCVSLDHLKRIHALSITLGFLHNLQSFACKLLEAYKNLHKPQEAQRVFDHQIPHPDIISWTSLLNLYLHSGLPTESLAVFSRFINIGLRRPDSFLVVGALSSCGRGRDLIRGRIIHGMILRNRLDLNPIVGNALIDMYCRNGGIEVAVLVFDRMSMRDVFSWTSLFNGYVMCNNLGSARKVFEEMPERNSVSWTAMISGYVKGGAPIQALKLFKKMEAYPSAATVAAVLSGCADTGALHFGQCIHGNVNKTSLKMDVTVSNAMMDMYSKSGRLDLAIGVFNEILHKDVFSWTTMISGYAYHGEGHYALEVYSHMVESGILPNEVTLLALLTACSHEGLVMEGKKLFTRMIHYHCLKPNIEHYGCLVDLLGRAGFLEEAKQVIEFMPMNPDVAIWRSLLTACLVHGNLSLAEIAGKKVMELDLSDDDEDGVYMLLWNVYYAAKKWTEASEIRKWMRDRRVKRKPGCSWIEVNGVVNEFLVEDKSHSVRAELYYLLKAMKEHSKTDPLGMDNHTHSSII
ncbi:pentatricopeptide repeat-containing protein [Senna tora]|uniref:Pentatricopeptide repeat-containing protein n=1 Tax=Senna tora TaxID=362788 RepID=A0A834T182_9FABA|nr:pentatricopeptide repeat-containing protein [Senna tora]